MNGACIIITAKRQKHKEKMGEKPSAPKRNSQSRIHSKERVDAGLGIAETFFGLPSRSSRLTRKPASCIVQLRPSCKADPGNRTPARAYRLRASGFC